MVVEAGYCALKSRRLQYERGRALSSKPKTRHCELPFPSYRHIPGKTPHPTRSAEGHSYRTAGTELPVLPDLNQEDPLICEQFLYGIDLFNHHYWWECHEALEALWHVAGRGSPAGNTLQAVIMCAAAHLKIITGNPTGGFKLFCHAEEYVSKAGPRDLGLDLVGLLADTGAHVTGNTPHPACLVFRD